MGNHSRKQKPNTKNGKTTKAKQLKDPKRKQALSSIKKNNSKAKNIKKPTALEKARTEFLSKQAEKMTIRESKNKARDEAIKNSILKKKEKAVVSKELDRRTKKGQPFMAQRMKNMLEKIEKDVDKYKMCWRIAEWNLTFIFENKKIWEKLMKFFF